MENHKNRNRRSLDIVGELLSIMLAKVKKTKIMYQANLNYCQVQKYLKVLLDGGLVQYDEDFCYVITQKGRAFLKTYTDYLERCSRINKEIEGNIQDRRMLEGMCLSGK